MRSSSTSETPAWPSDLDPEPEVIETQRRQRPEAAVWHLQRASQIVREHPEARALFGPDPRSASLIALLVVLQFAAGWAASLLPVWGAVLVAWMFGTVLAHALGVAIHELAHDLVFPRRWMNKAFAIFANLPLGFPAAIDFRDKHLRHHRWLGDSTGEDTQAPTPEQDRFAGDATWKRAIWLAFGPVVFHGVPSKDRRPLSHWAWIAANVILCLSLWPPVFLYSPSMFAYLFFSALLAFGPHPVGIRRYAEHVALAEGQPTSSYYGFWNRFAFNVGYHVEHHDFPGIPWTRITRLRQIAPEHYEPLAKVDSWSRLLLRFLFDPAYRVGRYARLTQSAERYRSAL